MTVPSFQPRSYTDISSKQESIDLWRYLNKPESKIKMATASDLGRPALEALASELLDAFPHCFTDTYPNLNRFKQMAGAMTKQVMDALGYEWERDNIPLSGAPFSRASRYRSRGTVSFHIWRLSTDMKFVGVTLERSASCLPRQPKGEWVYWKLVEGSMQDTKLHLSIAAGISDVPAALQALREKGAYFTSTQRLLRAA
jgi:hypothetical protein